MTTIDWVPVLEAVRKAAGVDCTLVDDDSLCADEAAIGELHAALAAAESTRIAALHGRGVPDRIHGLRTPGWVAKTTKVSSATARTRTEMAQGLVRWFPAMLEALVDGRVSADHARELVRVANPRIVEALAEVEQHLVTLAEAMHFTAWKRELGHIVYQLDEDGPEPRDHDRHHLSMTRTTDGILYLRGALNGDAAAVVESVLNQLTDALARRRAKDADKDPDLKVPARSQLMADALYDAMRRAIATDTDTASTRPGRTEVLLVMNAADPTEVTTAGGVPLHDGITRLLCCDPYFQALVVNTLGEPLDMGRQVRLATPAQRRAIRVRDGGCAFPGCDCPPEWCDIHHVIEWDDDGPTDIVNLVMLCRYHHGVTHRRGWSMHAADHQWFYWVSPTGNRFWSQRHGQPRQHAPPPPARC